MIEFIIKYWVQVILGLIVAMLTCLCKKFWSLYKGEQEHQKISEQQNFYDGILTKIDEAFSPLEERLSQIENRQNSLTSGLLSVQGAGFKRQCKKLLEPNYELTDAEWLQLEKDYSAYSALGGNGQGHDLYEAVSKKYYNVE